MRLPPLLCTVSILLATPWLPAVAHADQDPSTLEAAEQLFNKGVDVRNAGDYEQALSLFQRSYAAYPSTSASYNIAFCEKYLGRTVAAYAHFEDFIRKAKQDDVLVPKAKDEMAQMQTKGPWVRLRGIDELPSGASISLDGLVFHSTGPTMKIPAEPGKHIVVLQLPHEPERRLSVFVTAGETREVNVGGDPPSSSKAGFVVAGVGVASLTAGAITGGLALWYHSEVKRSCAAGESPCTQPEFNAFDDTGKRLSHASTTTFIIGGSFLAAGATMLLWPKAKSKELAIAPLVLPGGGGAEVSWRF